MTELGNYKKLKHELLQKYWGYESFNDFQEQAIDSITSGKDTLCLLPTGGGKSLCYQLPALISEGTCLVISPLLALMKEQVNGLKSIGIEAEYLTSEMNDVEEDQVYYNCKDGITKLLYISPERLVNQKFLFNVPEIEFSFIAIDEAHCISEWGQDFRPSYQNIRIFREQFADLPCIALTATATPKVVSEIQEKLGLKKPTILKKSFRRNNIRIIVNEISDKIQQLYHFLHLNQVSGLIYTNTRKEAEELYHFLSSKGIQNIDFYHAGLPTSEKSRKQKWWLNSNSHVLISTNAFGMGINKENVRFVIHYNPPTSIENYYQEIGRAGRDQNDSVAILFWNKQDLTKTDDIFKNQIPAKKEYEKIITYLYSLYQIADYEKVNTEFQVNFENLKKLSECSSAKIKNVLDFLHNQEIIYLKKSANKSSVQLTIPFEEIETLAKSDAYFLELLQRNLPGFTQQKIHFSEKKLSEKLMIQPDILKEKFQQLQKKNYLEYIDGAQASIIFLHPRNDRDLKNKYYKLFETIQRNKIKKWEEFKFYITDTSYCKMKLILHYFGEKSVKDCHHCSICDSRTELFSPKKIHEEILSELSKRPLNIDELSILLSNHSKEKILENLIFLLDTEKIKMLNYRTYTIA